MPTGSDLEAEAKHRGSAASRISPDLAPENFTGDAKEDATGKSRHSSVWRPVMRYLKSFAMRRWADVVGVGLFAFQVIWSWIRTTGLLLTPPDSVFVQVMGPVYRLIFFTFVFSWITVAYHGPGRVPPVEKCSLPSKLQDALAVGMRSKKRPFDGSGGWCGTCSSWKPAMAHHCHQCARCSIWMDHHCNFIGNCIGFRNMRCFIIFLYYAWVYIMTLLVCSIRYIYLHPPQDRYDCIPWLPWFLMVINHNRMFIKHQLSEVGSTVRTGWTHLVFRQKFDVLAEESKELADEFQTFLSTNPLPDSFDEMSAALNELKVARQNVIIGEVGPTLGIFFEPGGQGFEYVFGSRRSWRWCVPGIPGGHEDPLRPFIYESEACAGWKELAAVWERTEHALQKYKLEAEKIKHRLEQLVKEAESWHVQNLATNV